jgi:hypothetical protein
MIPAQLAELRKEFFLALILDNEVTVGHFVVEPPLPWLRLVQRGGIFQLGAGYPGLLTADQAQFEMTNWDEVSLPAIERLLGQAHESVDYCVIGNNAGQGLPLARSLSPEESRGRAAVIYAQGLPERKQYQQLGYRDFWPRDQAVAHLFGRARIAARRLALVFVNTIQHNEANYHMP